MNVNFGFVINDECVLIASSEIVENNINSLAGMIALRYVEFKSIVDKYGYATYLELCEDIPELPDLIDAYLDPLIGNNDRDTSDSEGVYS